MAIAGNSANALLQGYSVLPFEKQYDPSCYFLAHDVTLPPFRHLKAEPTSLRIYCDSQAAKKRSAKKKVRSTLQRHSSSIAELCSDVCAVLIICSSHFIAHRCIKRFQSARLLYDSPERQNNFGRPRMFAFYIFLCFLWDHFACCHFAALPFVVHATPICILKTPDRKSKSSREQDSSGDKLVTRSGVLYETKKVCIIGTSCGEFRRCSLCSSVFSWIRSVYRKHTPSLLMRRT